ncbi:MAG: hypothetical protein LBT25_05340, partial [Candidatus Symbiothrix sp.]|nr:hypothetical protein [Candidatus Symbiothrix sp.]
MKRKQVLLVCCIFAAWSCTINVVNGQIPLPSPAQLHWQQKERMMFLHFAPATWQGREYDNRSYPIEQIHLSAINTDQWCEV